MGILGFIGKKIVEKTAEVGVAVVAVKTGEALENSVNNSKRKKTKRFIEKKVEGHTKLLLSQDLDKLKETFKVYDQDEKVKYVVKGKLISATHELSIYDETGENKLAEVKEKLIALRSPLSLDSHPQDFVLILNGKKIGMVKSRYSIGKQKFECTYNGWKILGNFIGSSYKVYNKEEVVMKVDKKLALHEDLYFVDILNKEDELLCLMIALAIDSSMSSKTRDNRRALRRKF